MLLAYEPPSVLETDELLATVDISAGDDRFNTALHVAAEQGHCSVADTLLSEGASVRTKLAALCALSNMPTNIHVYTKHANVPHPLFAVRANVTHS